MQVITKNVLIILLVSLASVVTCSTNSKVLLRDDNDNDILRQLLQRIYKMQSHIDRMEINNFKRFNQLDAKIKADNNFKRFNQLDAKMKADQSVVMKTIVEQQTEPTAQPETKTPKPVKSFPNCAEAMGKKGPSGVYKIHVNNFSIDPFDAYCLKSVEYKTTDGAWLVIQRRLDNTTEFYQNWSAYQSGFGDLKKNFWIGLDKLYALTKSTKQELWIQLTDRDGIRAWAKYGAFAIGDESESYKLKVLGRYHGTAGDSLSYLKGEKWSTFDKDNDRWSKNCAEDLKAAWWYSRCGYSSLNGEYGDNDDDKGIIWHDFRGWDHSMKYAHMAIRPKTYE